MNHIIHHLQNDINFFFCGLGWVIGRMIRDLLQAFTDVGNDSNVRAVVLSGSGRMFTAGLDCK